MCTCMHTCMYVHACLCMCVNMAGTYFWGELFWHNLFCTFILYQLIKPVYNIWEHGTNAYNIIIWEHELCKGLNKDIASFLLLAFYLWFSILQYILCPTWCIFCVLYDDWLQDSCVARFHAGGDRESAGGGWAVHRPGCTEQQGGGAGSPEHPVCHVHHQLLCTSHPWQVGCVWVGLGCVVLWGVCVCVCVCVCACGVCVCCVVLCLCVSVGVGGLCCGLVGIFCMTVVCSW